MRTIVHFIVFIGVITLFQACDDSRYFEESKPLEDQSWGINEKIGFEFDVEDTVNTYDFFINLRNGSDYPYANIWVFVDYTYPNSSTFTDTIECPLATPDGRWIGSGIGDIIDNKILFKKNARFPLAGHYNINFRHGMRDEEVPQIMDVGLRISHSH